MTHERGQRLPYGVALRVIGRHLDAEPTYHLNLLEVADGFVVRTHPSRFRSDARTEQYGWERLHDLVVFHMAGRGCLRRRPRHSGIWANFPNGHEDFFRALGHRLDGESASSLSVEEMPDGVDVSYMRPAEGDVLRLEKAHFLLANTDIEQMLEEARRRRTPVEPRASSGTSG